MDRPALQRLLRDIKDRKVDIVVVYKIDRLTRSLADFAKIVERFEKRGVTFVSVTQSFNTTTSMGRLTLNVLLSFAQFEREVTAERIRDKFAASRRKGMWMGGVPPSGYRVENRKLLVDEDDAAHVQWIFTRFIEVGSCTLLAREVGARGLDGGGDVSLPDLQLATEPVVLVVGSEGKGLSRLVTETCDAVVSIPIESSTESLNAGIAVSVALYEVSRKRAVSR